jgi:hypothetical protein
MHLHHDLLKTNNRDLRRRVETRRRAEAAEPVVIRTAGAGDRDLLARLAALDSAEPPAGEVLLAEVGGEPHAALELGSGRFVADPFRPTRELRELLALRARLGGFRLSVPR